ncbi:MAG: holo-ACP synthase [Armatimonadetes bacterium]|nr:holo-ACP synthase [Armatimonadota bacterium]
MIPAVPTGGRVVAVGVDIADVGRIRAALARDAERFARRVLTTHERAYCFGRPDPAPHVAARFAAKEAVIKCLGGGCGLRDVEVVRALTGFPSISLTGRAAIRANGCRVLISLSHLPDLATAFAVLIEAEPIL